MTDTFKKIRWNVVELVYNRSWQALGRLSMDCDFKASLGYLARSFFKKKKKKSKALRDGSVVRSTLCSCSLIPCTHPSSRRADVFLWPPEHKHTHGIYTHRPIHTYMLINKNKYLLNKENLTLEKFCKHNFYN